MAPEVQKFSKESRSLSFSIKKIILLHQQEIRTVQKSYRPIASLNVDAVNLLLSYIILYQAICMSYHHGNLKESLIYAGEEELQLHGLANLSMREIAKRAGVSHNAPYRHFHNKTDLIQQIIIKTLVGISDQILSAPLLYPGSLLMQIQFIGRIWCQLCIHHPKKAHLIFSGLNQGRNSAKIISSHYRMIQENLLFVLEQARGHELLSNTPCRSLSLALLSCMHGIATLHTSEYFEAYDKLPEESIECSDTSLEIILRAYLA